ncbi:MAG: PQQ-binding-like beta-propeller repeat protein [Thermoanaerobaculia bacterium]
MQRTPFRSAPLALGIMLAVAGPLARPARAETNWPSFRGANASGVSDGASLPERWRLDDSTGIRWKTPIPGLGHSSPVVWGDRIYLTTAISGTADPELKVGLYGNIDSVKDDTVHKFELYALDKSTGAILWKRTAHQGVPATPNSPSVRHGEASPRATSRAACL